MNNKKSISAVFIFIILNKYSNMENPLRVNYIIELLKKEYNVEVERKAVGRMLNTLVDGELKIYKNNKGWYAA